MTPAMDYLARCRGVLGTVETQLDAISQAADWFAQTILAGRMVHVFGSGLDTFAQAGSNSLYGPSGWEVPVGANLAGNVYQVELQTMTGTIISQPVTVVFTPNDCSRNLALVNFAANRAF